MNKYDIHNFVNQRKAGSIWIEGGKIKSNSLDEDIQEAVRKANEQESWPMPMEGDEHSIKAVKLSDIPLEEKDDEISFLQDMLPDGYELWNEGSEGPTDDDYFAYYESDINFEDPFIKMVNEGFSEIKLSESNSGNELDFNGDDFEDEKMEMAEENDDESVQLFNPYHDKSTGHFTYRPGGPFASAMRATLKKKAHKYITKMTRDNVRKITKAGVKEGLTVTIKGNKYGIKAPEWVSDIVADYTSELTVRVMRPKVNKYIDVLITKAVKSKHPEEAVSNIKIDEKVLRDMMEKDVAMEIDANLGALRREIRRRIAGEKPKTVKAK